MDQVSSVSISVLITTELFVSYVHFAFAVKMYEVNKMYEISSKII